MNKLKKKYLNLQFSTRTFYIIGRRITKFSFPKKYLILDKIKSSSGENGSNGRPLNILTTKLKNPIKRNKTQEYTINVKKNVDFIAIVHSKNNSMIINRYLIAFSFWRKGVKLYNHGRLLEKYSPYIPLNIVYMFFSDWNF